MGSVQWRVGDHLRKTGREISLAHNPVLVSKPEDLPHQRGRGHNRVFVVAVSVRQGGVGMRDGVASGATSEHVRDTRC